MGILLKCPFEKLNPTVRTLLERTRSKHDRYLTDEFPLEVNVLIGPDFVSAMTLGRMASDGELMASPDLVRRSLEFFERAKVLLVGIANDERGPRKKARHRDKVAKVLARGTWDLLQMAEKEIKEGA